MTCPRSEVNMCQVTQLAMKMGRGSGSEGGRVSGKVSQNACSAVLWETCSEVGVTGGEAQPSVADAWWSQARSAMVSIF